jgi:hypothetical protein
MPALGPYRPSVTADARHTPSESTRCQHLRDAVPLAWTSVHLNQVKSCSVADRKRAMRQDNGCDYLVLVDGLES